MDWKLAAASAGANALGSSIFFKLLWSEIKAIRKKQDDIFWEAATGKVEIAKLYERLAGHTLEIRELKKAKR